MVWPEVRVRGGQSIQCRLNPEATLLVYKHYECWPYLVVEIFSVIAADKLVSHTTSFMVAVKA